MTGDNGNQQFLKNLGKVKVTRFIYLYNLTLTLYRFIYRTSMPRR
jgi:hypothetical protein